MSDYPSYRPITDRRDHQGGASGSGLTAIRDGHTLGAETFGMLYLMGAHFAAQDEDADAAEDRLREAERLAALTGEQNGLRQHFRPTNVQVWRVAVGTELRHGRP